MIKLSGLQSSTSEQYYPSELTSDGSKLFCKTVSLGVLPNNGTVTAPHNLPNYHPEKIHRVYVRSWQTTSGGNFLLAQGGWNASSYDILIYLDPTNVVLTTTRDMSTLLGNAEIIYKK